MPNQSLSEYHNINNMRSRFTLLIFLFSISILQAQVKLEEFPLESNVVLQRVESLRLKAKEDKLTRYFGAESTTAESRMVAGDCEDDGFYESGETVYIISGEDLEICLDTTGFITFNNLSVEGNNGSTSTNENCITYAADAGIDLGLGDTIKVELCLPDGGACVTRIFPVVVKRENATFVEASINLSTESDAILCVDPANYILPSEITGSSILDCHDLFLADVSNGNSRDSCALLTSTRFAGLDTVCLEISNDFCISDTYKFPFRVIGDTIDLPFLDDFSYEGPFPGKLWADKEAYVNTTFPFQPPTVGVATMDGLDPTGSPWGGGYGRSDFLTSNYIDLSPYTNSSNVFLTCAAQPKGYGFAPSLSDSLIIEFKKSDGEWVKIHTFQGLPAVDIPFDSFPAFDQSFSFGIISSSYLYDGFQFRFVNYGTRTGIRDVWHIDYVKLTANQVPDGSFEDIAFTNVPNDILKDYSSVPWRHFESSMLIDFVDIELYSQFDVVETANPSGKKLTELESGSVILDQNVLLLTDATAPENQRNVPPKVHKFHTNPIDISDAANESGDKLVFELEYHFEVDGQNAGLFPAVMRNDTVKKRTVFDNYFAYDDGSAERSINIAEVNGEAIAQVYTTLEPDTLRAIQIHFPRDNDQENARFNIKVHVGELGNVVFEQFGLQPFFADSVLDTLQGFTTIRLADDFDNLVPVALPAGDFYVELEQANSQTMTRIGFDANTEPAQAFQFLKIFGQWGGLGNEGALMMRPVLGSFTPPNTAVKEIVNAEKQFKVYPNPSTGVFNIEQENINLEDYEYTVFNSVGQVLRQEQLQEPTIDLNVFNNGVYYIKIKNLESNQIETHKVLIFKN